MSNKKVSLIERKWFSNLVTVIAVLMFLALMAGGVVYWAMVYVKYSK